MDFFLSVIASKNQTQYVIYSMTPDNRNWSLSVQLICVSNADAVDANNMPRMRNNVFMLNITYQFMCNKSL